MPTYDYQCAACGHEFEEFQRISEEPLKKCPECKKNKLNRLFGTGAAIVFRGSGFYETDYRSDSYKKGADAAKKAADKKTGGDSGKKSSGKADSGGASDSKPAAKKSGSSGKNGS